MKLLILSDSHGNVDNMVRAADLTAPRMILHLGDCWRDAEKLRELRPEIPMEQVPGNCDCRPYEPTEKLLCLEGRSVLLCHGHTYGVKQSLTAALFAARERQVDLFLFGHTHRPFLDQRDGIWFLNPGSIGDWAAPSYAVVELGEGDIRADLRRL